RSAPDCEHPPGPLPEGSRRRQPPSETSRCPRPRPARLHRGRPRPSPRTRASEQASFVLPPVNVVRDLTNLLLPVGKVLQLPLNDLRFFALFRRLCLDGRRGLLALVLAGIVLGPLVDADLQRADHL